MNKSEAKQFYEERRVPRYGFLQTSEGHIFTEFAKQGKTDPQFAQNLAELGNHMARLHKEATTANKTDVFKQKAIELIKHHETTMTKGASAKDALRRLNRHFKAPTLEQFLKQTAVAAVKERPTSSKPETKVLKAAPVSLPRVSRKPGLLRHALGLTTLGALLAFGVPYAAKQLPHSTTPTLQNQTKTNAPAPRPPTDPRLKPPDNATKTSKPTSTTSASQGKAKTRKPRQPTDTPVKPPDNTAKASKPAAAALTPQNKPKTRPPAPKNRSDVFLKRAYEAAKAGELGSATSILESGLKAGALTQEDVSKAFLEHADNAAKEGRLLSAAWILGSGVSTGALAPRDLSDDFLKHADSAAKAGLPTAAASILDSGVKAGALTSEHSDAFLKHADSAAKAGEPESAALILEAAGKLHLKSGGKAGLASAERIVEKLRSDKLQGYGRVPAASLLEEILKRKAKN